MTQRGVGDVAKMLVERYGEEIAVFLAGLIVTGLAAATKEENRTKTKDLVGRITNRGKRLLGKIRGSRKNKGERFEEIRW